MKRKVQAAGRLALSALILLLQNPSLRAADFIVESADVQVAVSKATEAQVRSCAKNATCQSLALSAIDGEGAALARARVLTPDENAPKPINELRAQISQDCPGSLSFQKQLECFATRASYWAGVLRGKSSPGFTAMAKQLDEAATQYRNAAAYDLQSRVFGKACKPSCAGAMNARFAGQVVPAGKVPWSESAVNPAAGQSKNAGVESASAPARHEHFGNAARDEGGVGPGESPILAPVESELECGLPEEMTCGQRGVLAPGAPVPAPELRASSELASSIQGIPELKFEAAKKLLEAQTLGYVRQLYAMSLADPKGGEAWSAQLAAQLTASCTQPELKAHLASLMRSARQDQQVPERQQEMARQRLPYFETLNAQAGELRSLDAANQEAMKDFDEPTALLAPRGGAEYVPCAATVAGVLSPYYQGYRILGSTKKCAAKNLAFAGLGQGAGAEDPVLEYCNGLDRKVKRNGAKMTQILARYPELMQGKPPLFQQLASQPLTQASSSPLLTSLKSEAARSGLLGKARASIQQICDQPEEAGEAVFANPSLTRYFFSCGDDKPRNLAAEGAEIPAEGAASLPASCRAVRNRKTAMMACQIQKEARAKFKKAQGRELAVQSGMGALDLLGCTGLGGLGKALVTGGLRGAVPQLVKNMVQVGVGDGVGAGVGAVIGGVSVYQENEEADKRAGQVIGGFASADEVKQDAAFRRKGARDVAKDVALGVLAGKAFSEHAPTRERGLPATDAAGSRALLDAALERLPEGDSARSKLENAYAALTEKQREALVDAHLYRSPDAQPGVPYSQGEKVVKGKKLLQAGISKEDARLFLDTGVAGDPARLKAARVAWTLEDFKQISPEREAQLRSAGLAEVVFFEGPEADWMRAGAPRIDRGPGGTPYPLHQLAKEYLKMGDEVEFKSSSGTEWRGRMVSYDAQKGLLGLERVASNGDRILTQINVQRITPEGIIAARKSSGPPAKYPALVVAPRVEVPQPAVLPAHSLFSTFDELSEAAGNRKIKVGDEISYASAPDQKPMHGIFKGYDPKTGDLLVQTAKNLFHIPNPAEAAAHPLRSAAGPGIEATHFRSQMKFVKWGTGRVPVDFNPGDLEYAKRKGRFFEGRTHDLSDLPRNQAYTWVLHDDGTANFGLVVDSLEFGVKHKQIAGKGKIVRGAGEMFIDSNGVVWINQLSGGYGVPLSRAGVALSPAELSQLFGEKFSVKVQAAGPELKLFPDRAPSLSEVSHLCVAPEFLAKNKGVCDLISKGQLVPGQ